MKNGWSIVAVVLGVLLTFITGFTMTSLGETIKRPEYAVQVASFNEKFDDIKKEQENAKKELKELRERIEKGFEKILEKLDEHEKKEAPRNRG